MKVDGTDALAVYDAVNEGVTRARKGEGPSMVEAVTMRMHGHAEHDPADYVPREMFEEWRKKDPELFERRLVDSGVISDVTAKPGKRLANTPSTRAARRSRTRCLTAAQSRTVSMPTEADAGGVTYLEAIGQAMMSESRPTPTSF